MDSTAWQVFDRLHGDVDVRSVMGIILRSRGIESREAWNAFVAPIFPGDWDIKDLEISDSCIEEIISLLEKLKGNGKRILVYGDYDADGVCASCVMCERLRDWGYLVDVHIPDRRLEGYTMKVENLEKLLQMYPETGMVITVDQGIVANDAVAFLREKKIDVVITDHHEEGSTLPDANVIVHTTMTSGSGIAWYLTYKLGELLGNPKDILTEGLGIAAIGTIADVLPLREFNRSLVWHGLKALRTTQRPGLLSLLESAEIDPAVIDAYHVGFQIGPRINAMGRLKSAQTALDLLTNSQKRESDELAAILEQTNRKRQRMTEDLVTKAIRSIEDPERMIVINSEDFDEGVMGLIAGKLVEKFYRPAIVICKKSDVSKASCRSVNGFNIVEFLREHEDLFEGVGGHAMAAGFSVRTDRLDELYQRLMMSANKCVLDESLQRSLVIDCELPLRGLSFRLHELLQEMAPFGAGNSTPVFATFGKIKDLRRVGSDGKHLKIVLSDGGITVDGIGFGKAELGDELLPGDAVEVAFTLDVNVWRGKKSLQMMIKDIKLNRE